MRSRFDEQLAELNQEMTEMGGLCEKTLGMAAKALVENDKALAAQVIPVAAGIDRQEKNIETLCLRLLLQQQPVARDLRQISAALKMITDMERIGDQAEDIAEIIGFLNGHSIGECTQIADMAQAASRMVTEAVDAYVRQDVELARSVLAYDDVVDEYFTVVKQKLIEMIAREPASGEYALDLLMIAKYFERIGDHATNIAEWVEFAVTGVHKNA